MEERVDGRIVALGDPIREVPQKRSVSKGLRRSRLGSPPRSDPLLEQPLSIAVDVGLEGVRRMAKQRQVQQLGGGDVDIVTVAAVRRRDVVSDRGVHPWKRGIQMVVTAGGQRSKSIPLLSKHVEDGRMASDELAERHLVAKGDAREHRGHGG